MSGYYDVLVVGAGVAGTFCALHAAGRGLRVALLEHNADIGAKIRVSGGGRCNFTNLHADSSRYLSENPDFCRSALARFTPQDSVAWFAARGVSAQEKAGGQLFAAQRSRAVIAALHTGLACSQAVLITDCRIRRQQYCNGLYQLDSNQGVFSAPHLVIATGGLSFAKLGASDFALRTAKQYGVKNFPFKPALVPLTLAQPYRGLSGVSCEVVIQADHAPAFRDNLLFTHRGLSGPAVLQISSYLSKGAALRINFLPDCAPDCLLRAKKMTPQKTLVRFLREYLPKALADCLAQPYPGEQALAAYSHARLRDITRQLQQYVVYPSGNEGMNKAEVCTGGVDTRALNPKTFMVKERPGLYFIGEAVDMTGWLGGYNFQWAWSSGWCCAQHLPLPR